jgi:hypothetical protein
VNRAPRILVFALATGLTASLAFIASWFGLHEVFRHAPGAPPLAALLLAAALPLGWLGTWAIGSRGPVAGALGVAAVASMIFWGALHELQEPLIHAHPRWCGTGRMMEEMAVPPAMLAAGTLGGLVAALLLWRAAGRLDGAVRALATATTTFAALALAASLVRAARAPETDGYVEAQPIVATVRAASGQPERVRVEAQHGSMGMTHEDVDVYDDPVEGLLLRRTCQAGRCGVSLVAADTPRAEAKLDDHDVTEGTLLEVRRDVGHALWLVHGQGTRAYRVPGLRRVDVGVRDVAGSLSPPRAWLASAAVGLGLALGGLALRRRVARRRAAIAAGREGVLEASGLVKLAGDEHPVRAAAGQALDEGPVVVLPGALAAGGVYRGDAARAGAQVVCGVREDLLAAADARLARLDALVFAAAALTAAPLAAAAAVGIVV